MANRGNDVFRQYNQSTGKDVVGKTRNISNMKIISNRGTRRDLANHGLLDNTHHCCVHGMQCAAGHLSIPSLRTQENDCPNVKHNMCVEYILTYASDRRKHISSIIVTGVSHADLLHAVDSCDSADCITVLRRDS